MKKISLFLVMGLFVLSCNNSNNNAPTYVANQEQPSDTTIEVKEELKEEEPQLKADNNPIDPVRSVYGLVFDDWKHRDPFDLRKGTKLANENLTQRFQIYNAAIDWDADYVYETQDMFSPAEKPTVQVHEDNPYVFDVKWTEKYERRTIKKTVIVALEDGKWKIDNFVDGKHRRYDYSKPIQKVYQEDYPDESYIVPQEDVAKSKKKPEFVPDL